MAGNQQKNPPVERGTLIGNRFLISERLGQGGLGMVYSAEDRRLGQEVALKFRLVPKGASTEVLERNRRRLRRGARAAQQISHPRVCRIHDFHEIDGYEFVAMERIHGLSLRETLAGRTDPLEPNRVTALGLDLCQGLRAIHEQGFVHQDIKPANLLFDAEGRIKITDFDIAGARWRGLTLQYAAPEQLRAVSSGDKDSPDAPTAASDLFSVGCVLYEAATLHQAYPSGSLSRADPKAPTYFVPELPRRLVRAIGACLQRDPDDRPQSARELEHLLTKSLDDRPPLEPGTLLGARFAIEKRLGSGNSGVVYQAHDQGLDTQVALKFWNPDNLLTEPTPKMIEEVRKAQDLPGHPRLCRVVGFHTVDGYAFAAMELVEGEDLGRLIAREGRLEPERAIEIGLGICQGLQVIHGAGLVHQDIEPGNILLDANGEVKIADLGFAGRQRWWGRTLPYASPEQLLALEGVRTSKPTPGSDLFAVGCLLYEMLTGQQAFPQGCLVDYAPIHPSKLFPDIPGHLDQAVQTCLQRNLGRRPASAQKLAQLLKGTSIHDSQDLSGYLTDPLGVGPGSLSRMSRRLFKLLAHDPLVLLLLQDHHDLLRALSLVLHQVREEQVDIDHVFHLILPTSKHISIETFFSRLGPQCEIKEPIAGAAEWEAAIHDRLSRGEQMLFVISGWGRGLEAGRRELGRFLDSLTRQFNSLRAVLIGGEDLAALKFGRESSHLQAAEHLFWPEFNVEDVRRLTGSDFPDLRLPKAHAQELLELTGGHYRLLRACLRALENGSDVNERIFSDGLWSLFTPFRDHPEAAEKVRGWLGDTVVGPYDPWPADAHLRRLFWSGALADRQDRLEWRSPVFRSIGKRVLS